MSNEEKNIVPYELLTKHISGEISPTEESALKQWLQRDPGNRKILEEMEAAWESMDRINDVADINIDKEWERQQKALHFRDRTRQRDTRSLSYWNISKMAAVFLVLFAAAFAIYYFGPDFQQVRKTGDRQVLSVTLPDGTLVTLNENSTIKYPTGFKGTRRKVTLEGEAFFEVTEDKEKPFVIVADEAMIEVLGTSFNVNAFEENEDIVVTVAEGNVELYLQTSPAERLRLEHGTSGVLNKENKSLTKKSEPLINSMAWKTKQIILDDYTLSEAVQLLENVYKTSIRIKDPEISECHINATFDRQSLESVLKVIESTLDVRVKKVDDTYIIEGGGC